MFLISFAIPLLEFPHLQSVKVFAKSIAD